MTRIGFVGLGLMGSSMARNLMKNGFEVYGYARHPQKVSGLVEEGLILHDTLSEAAALAEVMISMVGFPEDVREVYCSTNGILDSMSPGTICIDMTTSDPDLARELHELAAEKGIAMLDAPVTGGDVGAQKGTLTILVGGNDEDLNKVMPVLEAMGSSIHYMGEAGMGQQAKLVNQILIAGAMAGVAEAWNYALESGLDTEDIYLSLRQGAAGSKSMDLYWPRLLHDDLQPGFFIKHFIKDMNLAAEQARAKGLHLEVLETVLQEYRDLNEPELGTQALIHASEKKN